MQNNVTVIVYHLKKKKKKKYINFSLIFFCFYVHSHQTQKKICHQFSNGKAAVTIIATFLLTSWIVSALISLNFNYTHKVAEPLESFGFLYEKPWTRLGPYVMGMYSLTFHQTFFFFFH